MKQPLKILLQTTIPPTVDDWNISRFSLLKNYLASLQDAAGNPLCSVVARDRDRTPDGNDPILSTIDQSDFDELCRCGRRKIWWRAATTDSDRKNVLSAELSSCRECHTVDSDRRAPVTRSG